jgi:hypothetical protein
MKIFQLTDKQFPITVIFAYSVTVAVNLKHTAVIIMCVLSLLLPNAEVAIA